MLKSLLNLIGGGNKTITLTHDPIKQWQEHFDESDWAQREFERAPGAHSIDILAQTADGLIITREYKMTRDAESRSFTMTGAAIRFYEQSNLTPLRHLSPRDGKLFDGVSSYFRAHRVGHRTLISLAWGSKIYLLDFGSPSRLFFMHGEHCHGGTVHVAGGGNNIALFDQWDARAYTGSQLDRWLCDNQIISGPVGIKLDQAVAQQRGADAMVSTNIWSTPAP